MKYSCLVCFLACFVAPISAQERLLGFDEYVERVRAEWDSPGVAIAVVEKGKTILSKGWGHRNRDTKTAVTPRTLFPIGSITKAFTSTLSAMLVDEGKLDWDTPVRQYLPDFELWDKTATVLATPRDLVTHRMGLPAHFAFCYGTPFTRDELYSKLKYLEPNRSFRNEFQYCNPMVMTAGYLCGRVMDTTWEELVKKRIFEPLGMAQSSFRVEDLLTSDDFAEPYSVIAGKLSTDEQRDHAAAGPASCINSSAEELIRFVDLHLSRGKWGGKQLVSSSNIQEMQRPVIPVPGSASGEFGASSYGLGLLLRTYRGEEIARHRGGSPGYKALMTFMPKHRVGIVVLTNLKSNNPVCEILADNLYDRLVFKDQIDWVKRELDDRKKAADKPRPFLYFPTQKKNAPPTHSLANLAGVYYHPAYGDINISVDDKGLHAVQGKNEVRLAHYHYNVFYVTPAPLTSLAGARVKFDYDKLGDIDRVSFPLEPSVSDITFLRRFDIDLRQKTYLAQFVGKYVIGPHVFTVAFESDDTLSIDHPKTPKFNLAPERSEKFTFIGEDRSSVRFLADESGQFSKMVLEQPLGQFIAERK